MLVTQAIAANSLRNVCKLSDLKGMDYCLVGDGAYAKDMLLRLVRERVTLPTSWWVTEYHDDYSEISQYTENEQDYINEESIVLGTGQFQIEMILRLQSRCSSHSTFLDVMLCAPQNSVIAARKRIHSRDYMLYFDQYSDINVPAFLSNLFTFVEAAGIQVEVHHPLEILSDEYVIGARSVVLWNGSTSAFLPLLDRVKKLKVDVTYAECGFFPQHEHFYFDKHGVNNDSQLYGDSLEWVTDEMLYIMNRLRHTRRTILSGKGVLEDESIFVPLQVPTDSNVISHSMFTRGMQEFINYIEDMYRGENIVFKPHPKDRNGQNYVFARSTVSHDDVSILVARANLVHGINSSVLYEAALQGKSIKVEGNCLLGKHSEQIDKLLAAIYYRQFAVADRVFNNDKIRRFSYLDIISKDNCLDADSQKG